MQSLLLIILRRWVFLQEEKTNSLEHCLEAVFLRLQTRAHKFKHWMTLLYVIFENMFQNVTCTEKKMCLKNLNTDFWRYCEGEQASAPHKNVTGIVTYHENCRKIFLSHCSLLVYAPQCGWIMKTCNLNKILTFFSFWVEQVSSCYNQW